MKRVKETLGGGNRIEPSLSPQSLIQVKEAIREGSCLDLIALAKGTGGFGDVLFTRRQAWRFLLESWSSCPLATNLSTPVTEPAPILTNNGGEKSGTVKRIPRNGDEESGPNDKVGQSVITDDDDNGTLSDSSVVQSADISSPSTAHKKDTIKPSEEERQRNRQIQLDVDRSSLSQCGWSAQTLALKKRDLFHIISAAFVRHPWLHYYQGYHDVGAICLRVMGDRDEATSLLTYLSLFYLRDFHHQTLAQSMNALAQVTWIVQMQDPSLIRHLRSLMMCDQDGPFIFHHALSWLLTWFSHVIPSFDVACRVFDYLLFSDSDRILYLSAACILLLRPKFRPCQSSEDVFTLFRDLKWSASFMDRACMMAERIHAYLHIRLALARMNPWGAVWSPTTSSASGSCMMDRGVHARWIQLRQGKASVVAAVREAQIRFLKYDALSRSVSIRTSAGGGKKSRMQSHAGWMSLGLVIAVVAILVPYLYLTKGPHQQQFWGVPFPKLPKLKWPGQ